MTVEERLRETMRAHEREAPARVPWPLEDLDVLRDLTGRDRRPRRRGALIAAAVIVVAMVATGISLAVVLQPGTPQKALATPVTCPDTWHTEVSNTPAVNTVPEKPTTANASARLVPSGRPDAVTICTYFNPDSPLSLKPTTLGLTGSRAVGGDLQSMADDLSYMPPIATRGPLCFISDPPAYPQNQTAYLIAVTYGDQRVWVSTSDEPCDGSSNGVFTSDVSLVPDIARTLTIGTWSPHTGGETNFAANDCGGAGRLGRDSELIPGTPTSLIICSRDSTTGVSRERTVARSAIGGLLASINSLNAEPWKGGCDIGFGPSGSDDPPYTLTFGYDVGPALSLTVSSVACGSTIDNLALQATASNRVLTMIETLA